MPRSPVIISVDVMRIPTRPHGLFMFGIGVYNLTNHSNRVAVSPYYGLETYRG